MATISHEVVINRPAQEIFAFVSDFTNWVGWRPGVDNAEMSSPGPVGVGTTWDLSGEVQGHVIGVTIEITEYVPGNKLQFKTISGPIGAQSLFALAPVDGGTRLNVTHELFSGNVDVDGASQQWAQDLEVLKERLEAQA